MMLSYGHLEAYIGYHGLEALVAVVERRGDGGSGSPLVQCLSGDAGGMGRGRGGRVVCAPRPGGVGSRRQER